jgi:adenosine deaminase
MALIDLEAFVRALPKAELHLHIEGSLEPEMVFELARKHGIGLKYATVGDLRAAYDFRDLQSFLDIYYACADVLRDEEDFYLMTRAYLRRAHADGVVHAEIFFDPQTHTARGIPMATVINGIDRAMMEADRDYGLTSKLILCFLRHLSESEAIDTYQQALPYRRLIAAVGLDSAEAGNPPAKFARVFARARADGLLAVAHAGEEGPPEYIYAAMDVLKVSRIDHGVRCDRNALLLRRLAEQKMPLTVCPLSNVRLKVFPRMEDHNLKLLLERGVRVTVNSDDPAYFGGYVLDNYMAAAKALKLAPAQLVQLARNSIEASFLELSAKQAWQQRIDEVAVTA